VVYPHHESAAQADEGDGGLKRAAVWPEVHDANFGLGEPMGSLDGVLKGDTLLQEVEVAVCGGDRIEFLVGWGKLNSLPGEGVKGLQEEIFAVCGKVFDVALGEPIVEEDSSWDRWVVEVGQGELADAEVPVGMTGPLYVEFVAVVEWEMNVFAL
jgi:hypothetical protein